MTASHQCNPTGNTGCVAEWKPAGFSLCATAQRVGLESFWIDPRHSRVERLLTDNGTPEWNCSLIALVGGHAKDLCGARQFREFYQSSQGHQRILIAPRLTDLVDMEFTPFTAYCIVGSAVYGDLIIGRWNIYAFGAFHLQRFLDDLIRTPSCSIARAYAELGPTPVDEDACFIQTHPVGGSVGLEIHMTKEDGSWRYSGESQICHKGAKDTIQSCFRWPKCQSTNLPPIVGQRIALSGGRPTFSSYSIPDDGYANDAVWRPSPSV